jgi:hypothetical protein
MIIVPTVRGFVKASAPKVTPTLSFDTPPLLPVSGHGSVTAYTPAHVGGGPFWVEWSGNAGNAIITAGGLSTDKVHNVTGMTVTTGMVLYGFGTLSAGALVGASYQIGFNMKTAQNGTLIGLTYFNITTTSPNV